MNYRTRSFLINAPLDFAVASGAYLLTFSIRLIGLPSSEFHITFILLAALILVANLWIFGVYKRLWDQTSGHGVLPIVRAVSTATIITLVLSLLQFPRPIPLSVVLVGSLLSLSGLVALRYRSRMFPSARRADPSNGAAQPPHTKVLIVGTGKLAQNMAYQLRHTAALQTYTIVGFIDDDQAKHGMYVEGAPVLGDRQAIPTIAQAHGIDLIILALKNAAGDDFRDILTYCENTSARLKVVPDVDTLLNPSATDYRLRDVNIDDLVGRTIVTRSDIVDMTPITCKLVLVTGAAGSIGSELSRQIAAYKPTHLVLLDSNESDLHDMHIDLRSRYPELPVTPVLGDVTLHAEMRAVFEQFRPQIVFHCAAYKHVPMLERYPQKAIQANVLGTKNVAELASEYHAERFVLISTDKAIDPSSVMGASKRLCELIVYHLQSESQTRFGAVRFGNVLGSRGSVVPMFTRQIDAGGPVTITDPNMTRFFMTIPEAVNLVLHAACLTHGGELFVLNMGESVRIVKLAERMIRLRGLRPYTDIPIEFIGIRPGEKLHEALYMEHEEAEPTIHPQILHVKHWKSEFSDEFWTQVNCLIDTHDPETIRKQLEQLVRLQTPTQEDPQP